MGALSWVVLASVAAAPASAAGVNFDGPSVSGSVHQGAALLRVGDAIQRGEGTASVEGQDRVTGKDLTYGDSAELWMRFQTGKDVYRVELDVAGFPPEQALRPAPRRGSLRRGEGAPVPPERSIEGGVMLGRTVGGAGEGAWRWPRHRADLQVFGVGRVYRNDEPLDGRVRIQAQLVPAGVLAPNGSLRKDGDEADPELHVIVEGLPGAVAPGGIMHFALDGAVREGEPEGPPLTADQQWESGQPMLVWRDEPGAPAERAPAEEQAEEESEEAGRPRAEEAAPAPPAEPAYVPPNTAPIVYQVVQSPAYGGAIFPYAAAAPGIPPMVPPPQTPGAPPTGTPGAPPLQTPSAPGAVPVPGVGSSQLLPIDHPNGLAPVPPSVGFAGAGIPSTPTVLNDGQPPPGFARSTLSPPPTPQPLNAQPLPIQPGSAPPMPGTNPFTGMPQVPQVLQAPVP